MRIKKKLFDQSPWRHLIEKFSTLTIMMMMMTNSTECEEQEMETMNELIEIPRPQGAKRHH